jgi:hypothetical protein
MGNESDDYGAEETCQVLLPGFIQSCKPSANKLPSVSGVKLGSFGKSIYGGCPGGRFCV